MDLNGLKARIGEGSSTAAETTTASEQQRDSSNGDRTNKDELKESEDVAEETKERSKVEN